MHPLTCQGAARTDARTKYSAVEALPRRPSIGKADRRSISTPLPKAIQILRKTSHVHIDPQKVLSLQ